MTAKQVSKFQSHFSTLKTQYFSHVTKALHSVIPVNCLDSESNYFKSTIVYLHTKLYLGNACFLAQDSVTSVQLDV